jgi:hypothetical protein
MKRITLILPVLTAGIIVGATATEIQYNRDAERDAVVVMPYCATEDGSDYPGRHCLWIDPDTGRGYINGAVTMTLGGAD